jgi:hypothetical protein
MKAMLVGAVECFPGGEPEGNSLHVTPHHGRSRLCSHRSDSIRPRSKSARHAERPPSVIAKRTWQWRQHHA